MAQITAKQTGDGQFEVSDGERTASVSAQDLADARARGGAALARMAAEEAASKPLTDMAAALAVLEKRVAALEEAATKPAPKVSDAPAPPKLPG